MLHIHFGAGRLGLGLAAPFLKTPHSELYLLNRASSGSKATGSTALEPARRNELLQNHPRQEYVLSPTSGPLQARETIHYDSFFTYSDGDAGAAAEEILSRSKQKEQGVLISASVLTLEHYAPVVEVLNAICSRKEEAPGAIGDVYLVACENTVSAHEVLKHSGLSEKLTEATRCHLRCVHALVDRVCVDLEEGLFDDAPTVAVRTEEYGSLKLEIFPGLESLTELLRGSRAEFSHHLHVEKEIKGWLLNGSHWLIALTAFKESGGDAGLKLNDYINETENHRLYAAEVIKEMRDGIEALLRSSPDYESFVEDVDVTKYLDGAAASILERFKANDDTLTRILARFKAPTSEEITTVESFVDRFLHKIEPPILAYQQEKGVPPKSATASIFNLFRLQASGTYVDTDQEQEQKTA
ncbi:MAG TPA: hypothetical protein VGD62_05485 [Acidobacteriaceae bacterium]